MKIQQRWNELDKKKYKTIMDEFKISQLTAKKYIHLSEGDIRSMDNPTVYRPKNKPTNNYINIIYKMYIAGIKPEVIFSYICKLGYCSTWCALDKQIAHILKNNFGVILPMKWYLKTEYPLDVIVIKRNEILKYITTKNKKKKKSEKVEVNIGLIETKYPIITKLKEIYDSIHTLLMGNDLNKLIDFIEKYRDSKLKGFIEGMQYVDTCLQSLNENEKDMIISLLRKI